MARQNLLFSSDRSSIEQILGLTTDDNLSFELFSQNFSNPGGDAPDSFDTFLVSGEFEFDLDLGLALNLGESSLGDVEVTYPVFADVILPELVVIGDAFSIETGEDFVVEGAEITAESLNFDQLLLEFFARSDGAALRDVSLFNAGFGTGIDIPIDFEIDPFDVSVPIFEVSGGEVDEDIIDGLSFRLATPEGVEKTGEQFGLGEPGDLDDAAVLIFEPLAELRLDPLQLLGNFPAFAPLDLLQVGFDEEFTFLNNVIAVEFDLTVLAPFIAAGFAVSQSFVFDPTAVTTNVVIEGETQVGGLGDNFDFGAFDPSDEAIQDGTLDGTITFDLAGDLLTDVTLQPIGSFGVEILSIGGSLAFNDNDPFEAQLGPFFEERIDIPINAFVIDVIDDLRISLPDDFFAPVSMDFSIPIVPPSAPELLDQPEVLQVSADQESPLVFAPMIVNDDDTVTPIELRLTVADGELRASSTGTVSVSGAGTGAVTLVGLEADLTDFLGGGGLAFVGDQNTTLTIVADDRDGFAGVAFPDIELIVSDAGGDAIAGSGNDDRLSAFDINGNGEQDDEDDGNTPVSFSGGGGDDVLTGGNRRDFLSGGSGVDFIFGGGDADDIFGGANADLIFGGDGDDKIRGDGGADQIDGDAGNDVIEGGGENDVIVGGEGDDELMGNDGDDTLDGEGGDDFAVGGAGNDSIIAESAFGGTGDDALFSDGPDGVIFGGAGNDRGRGVLVFGGAGDDNFDGDFTLGSQLFGGDGDDQFDGGDGDDTIFGEAGKDQLSGGGGDDLLEDREGQSTLSGGSGDDTLLAGDEDDNLDGDGGSDHIEAGGGNDTIFGGGGEDATNTIFAGDGNDRIFGGSGDDTIFGGEGDDTVRTRNGDSVVTDLEGDNEIEGGFGDDVITTGPGDDNIEGLFGEDVIRSGAGNDVLISNIFNETFLEAPGAALLDAGLGNDTLFGAQRDDTLLGGEGDDLLFALLELPKVVDGGEGEDQFRIGLDQTFRIDIFGQEDRLINQQDFFEDRIAVQFDFSANRVTDLQTGEMLHEFDAIDGVERIIIQRDAEFQEFRAEDGQTINTQVEQDVVIGTDTDDSITATRGGTDIFGGAGDDTLIGGGSALELPDGTVLVNALFGGAGDDQIFGGTFVDGGEGVDIINSGIGSDTVIADAADLLVDGGRLGNDLIDGSQLADQGALTIDLAGDFDVNFAHRGENQFLRQGDEFVALNEFESARGRDGGADTLLTISLDGNFLEGLGGDDTLGVQGAIGTRIDGGEGADTLALLGNRVFVNIEVILGEPGGAPGVMRSLKFPVEGNFNELISIENIIGADADNFPFELEGDSLTGNSIANLIAGRAGNDTINGLGGGDTILGGEGNDLIDGGDGGDFIEGNEGRDSLTGGAGADTFSFFGDIGVNTIDDFEPGEDRLEVIVADPAAIGFRTFFNNDGEVSFTLITVEGDETFGSILLRGLGEAEARQAVFQIAPRALALEENAPPVAVDDAAIVDEDASVLVDVLGNDSDADGDALTVFAVGAPSNGTAAIEGGAVRYTPNADFNDADAFTYDVSDGRGGVARATVNIDVTPVNDAPEAQPDRFETREDAVLNGSLFADNGQGADADIDSDQIFVFDVNGQTDQVGAQSILNGGSVLSVASNGVFTFDPNGAFDFLEDGETAETAFYYTLSDGALQDRAAVFITVNGVSDEEDAGIGGDGDEVFNGDDGDDVQAGGGGNDTLTGGGGADDLSGGRGADLLQGGAGGDTLSGGAGRDTLEGGGGRDLLIGNGGQDVLRGNGGRDDLRGGGGGDLLDGGGGRDMLDGGGGKDALLGGGGRDVLQGAGGADTLTGGKGADVLTGGGGRDIFEFTRGDGRDRITDFDQLRDKIMIEDGADSFGDLVLTQVGANTVIRFANVLITVENERVEDFSAGDFLF